MTVRIREMAYYSAMRQEIISHFISACKIFFQKISFYWLEFFTFFATIGLNIGHVGILNRYPWQDLIYCDFQTYNKWRWFKDSIRELGVFYGLSNSVDFTRNFGENTYLTSRTSSPLFDIGSFFYFITGNPGLSIFIKYSIYLLSLLIGLYILNQLLLQKYNSHFYLAKKLHIVIFVVFAFHPIFYHEVGPMVLWYLYITPIFLYLFFRLCENGKKSQFIYFSALPLYLALGAGDLFLFFYFPIFLIICLFIFPRNQRIVRDLFLILIYVEFITLISKLNYFLMTKNIDSNVHAGGQHLGAMLKNFLAPLYIFSTFLPYFQGPITLFMNIFLIVIFIWLFALARGKSYLSPITKIFLWINAYLVILLICFHGIPLLRSKIPSDFRYHFATLPIFVILMFMLAIHLAGSSINVKGTFLLKILTAMLIVTSMLTPYVFSKVIPSTSRRIISSSFKDAIMRDLPNCIETSIAASPYSNLPRSYFFMTQPIDNGRNDTLTYLIENGVGLGGRTFTQWEYATNRANYILNENEGLGGFNTYTLTSKDISKALSYMKKSASPFLLSTAQLQDKRFNYIGTCTRNPSLEKVAVPFKGLFSGRDVGNATLMSTVYVYEYSFSSKNVVSTYRSADASFISTCNQDSVITLPINYSNQVGVIANDVGVSPTRSFNNLVQITTNNFPCRSGLVSIYVFSHSWLNFLNLYLLLFLILLIYYTCLLNFWNQNYLRIKKTFPK